MIDVAHGPTGVLEIRIWRGRMLIEHTRTPNLIVIGSTFIEAQLLGGAVAGNSIAQIGFGSTTTTPVFGNTSLSSDAYYKAVDSVSYPQSNQAAFGVSFGQAEGNGLMLAEYGLLTTAGTLFSRLVRSAPLPKDASISLAATWTISF